MCSQNHEDNLILNQIPFYSFKIEKNLKILSSFYDNPDKNVVEDFALLVDKTSFWDKYCQFYNNMI